MYILNSYMDHLLRPEIPDGSPQRRFRAKPPTQDRLTKKDLSLRVQVPKNHILTQNLYYNYNYPKPKYLIMGFLDPLGLGLVGIYKGAQSFLGGFVPSRCFGVLGLGPM